MLVTSHGRKCDSNCVTNVAKYSDIWGKLSSWFV